MTPHPTTVGAPAHGFTNPADLIRDRDELKAARREVPKDIDATDLAVAVRQLAAQRDNLLDAVTRANAATETP